MGLRHDVAVYLGLADETPEERHARGAALEQASLARLLLNVAVGALVAAAVIGLVRCLLDGGAVTVARVIEKGWLVAAVIAVAGVARELWDLRSAERQLDGPRRP
jgi:hypothetical protein